MHFGKCTNIRAYEYMVIFINFTTKNSFTKMLSSLKAASCNMAHFVKIDPSHKLRRKKLKGYQ